MYSVFLWVLGRVYAGLWLLSRWLICGQQRITLELLNTSGQTLPRRLYK